MINHAYLQTIIDKATVARLATVDSECKPHLISVVFVFDKDWYFIPIDEKSIRLSIPKKVCRVIDGSDIACLRKLVETHRSGCNIWIPISVFEISIIYESKKVCKLVVNCPAARVAS